MSSRMRLTVAEPFTSAVSDGRIAFGSELVTWTVPL